MSLACPFRHQSHTSFRLRGFKPLIESSVPQARPRYFHHGVTIARNGSQQYRAFRSSATQPKQRGSRNVRIDQELRAFIEKWSASNDGHPTSPSPTSSEANPEEPDSTPEQRRARNLKTDHDLRAYTEERVVKDSDESEPLGDTINSHSATQRDSRSTQANPERPRAWDPYSKRGQDDLRALVSELKKSATEYREFEQKLYERPSSSSAKVKLEPKNPPVAYLAHDGIITLSRPHRDENGNGPFFDEPGHVEHINRVFDLPESPVIRRLRRSKRHKRAPTEAEVIRLFNNPWASLLASPVRQCQVTGVRLPRDLLVPWGLVTRPSDQDIYLMPHELAILEKLKPGWNNKEGRGGLSKSELMGFGQRNREEERETHSTSDDWKKLNVSIRILPYQPLAQQLTGRMISKICNGKDVTIRGAVERIIPRRVKDQIKQLKHYAGQEENILNLHALKWQPDIAERTKGIMRVRLLTVLETLGLEGRRGHTLDFIPIESLSTGHISLFPKEEKSWSAKYTFVASHRPSGTAESNRDPLDTAQEAIIDALSGSIILYVNADKPVFIPDQPAPVLSKTAPNLLPQSLCLENTLRIPVFNLTQLMGEPSRDTTAHSCRRVMQMHPLLHPPQEEDAALGPPQRVNASRPPDLAGEDSDADGSQPYLLLISKCVPRAHVLAKELWQLWRYQGGDVEHERESQERRLEDTLSALTSRDEPEGTCKILHNPRYEGTI